MNRFLILSSMRSGSNYLQNLLNSHTNIFCDDEIFNPNDNHIFKHGDFSKTYLSLRKKDALKYLDLFFSRDYPEEISHLGFRLFYNHAQKKDEVIIWKHLKEMKGLSVIHLKRKNILQNLLSLKLAQNTSAWLRNKGAAAIHYQPIALDYEECLAFFLKREKHFQRMDNLFAKQNIINIAYEDLAKRPNPETAKLLKHFGLKPKSLKSNMLRQNLQKTSEIILNYFELKEKFVGSAWEVFFEE